MLVRKRVHNTFNAILFSHTDMGFHFISMLIKSRHIMQQWQVVTIHSLFMFVIVTSWSHLVNFSDAKSKKNGYTIYRVFLLKNYFVNNFFNDDFSCFAALFISLLFNARGCTCQSWDKSLNDLINILRQFILKLFFKTVCKRHTRGLCFYSLWNCCSL